jgi:murein L,D-transpeptidase YcbB/YkuD
LKAFYEKRDFQPVWTGSAEATQAATQMRNVLMQADQQGLDGAAYPASSLQAAPSLASGRDAAYYDVTVTEALLRYARDVRVGRTRPNDIYKDVGLPASDFDASAALELALRNRSVNEFLTDLPPAHPEYRWLGEALVRYRGIAKQGGWPSLTTGSESDSNVKLLVKRLAMEDSMLANIPNPSANELHEAITRYQTRNGIKPDGKVGSETLAALNVPVLVRIQQIVANMERWRWVPRQFEHRYIAVNIPDQSLTFVQDGRVLMSSRVIVGRKTSPTPILRTVAGALVANPPWNVPGDIAANQILPNLKRNPNYLAAHNMVVMNGPADDPRGLTIQWNNIPPGQFPYEIRQLPNPVSAMGVVMLDSPNDFDVYLHDTPGKKPFDDNERGISNGCIRVQQIMPLASLALTNDLSAGLGQLNQAIASHETRRLTLDDPLPVYMLYWTAIADANGNVGFRSDRYNRDPPLITALAKTATATRS